MLWVAVPLLALLFTLAAGRSWPFRLGPDFPKLDGDRTHPGTAATLLVYSPDARTMRLQAKLLVAEPAKLPPLQISVTRGKTVDASMTATRPAGELRLEAGTSLRLTRGINTVRLALGGPGSEPTAFLVESARVTQSIFNAGNLLFCLALAAVTAGSILAARALGANGLDQFCAASLIGFLLLTATATLLSPCHLLTGGTWAGVLVAFSLALGAGSALRLARHPLPLPLPRNTLRPLEAVVLLAVACPAFVLHILLPISQWDDLMYHGPRAAYWMENASALPFVSHDDRLSVFPIGGDLLYACGTILSGSELPGKFLGSLSLPLLVFALFALLKNAGVRAGTALGVILVFATTPLVTYSALEIKPDLWLALLGVVTLHWVLTARRGDSPMSPAVLACLAAAGAGAALGVKWTAAPLLLCVPFAVRWPEWRRRSLPRLLPPAAAFAAALALGGAGPILLFNLWTSHHPFGPKEMRRLHQPDPGWHPVAVQCERLPFILFALPSLPGEAMRAAVARWELAAADQIGATDALWKESDSSEWPGRFVPRVKAMDDRFSLGWAFVCFGVLAGLPALRRSAGWEKRGDFLLVSALALIFVAAVVTQTRWQASAKVPERFLLPAFAFGLIAASWPVDRLLRGRKVAAGLVGVFILLHALPYGVTSATAFYFGEDHGWESPPNAQTVSELNAVTELLPPGRTILLLADQGCRDYPLFLARQGFANRVLPWGKAAYDATAFDRAVHRPGVDTVILVSPGLIDMTWDPSIDARPFVQDMDARTDFSRLPGTGEIVVYVRGN